MIGIKRVKSISSPLQIKKQILPKEIRKIAEKYKNALYFLTRAVEVVTSLFRYILPEFLILILQLTLIQNKTH